MQFRYTAIDIHSKKQSGELDVADEREAMDRLRAMGFTPISLTPGSVPLPWWQRDVSFSQTKVSETALQGFLFDLSYMLHANLALLPSVEMIAARMQNKRLKQILTGALLHLKNGQTLTEALRRVEPDLHHQTMMALQIGEKSNTLDAAAKQSAEALGAKIKLRSSIVSALIYPSILLTMAGVVLWVVLFYLLPVLEPLFEGTEGNNALGPLLGVRQAVIFGVQGLILLGLALLVALPFLQRTGALARFLDKMPVIGVLRRNARSQTLASTVANIMISGGDIDAALDVAIKTARKGTVRDQVKEVREKVQDGQTFSEALLSVDCFDPTLQQLAVLGEQGEKLPELMRVAADMLEDGLRKRFSQLVSMIVPVLTVTVGLFVGTLVVMTMGAVMSINELAQ